MDNETMTQVMEQTVEIMAEAYSKPPSSKGHFLDSAKKIGRAALQMPEEYRSPFYYHQARLLAMGDNRDDAADILKKLLKENPPLPEVIWLSIQISASGTGKENNERRWNYEDQLGGILPFSIWNYLRDSRFEQKESEKTGEPLCDGPDWPRIPAVKADTLMRIASLFEEMNLHAEAANAYREAVYGGFNPPLLPEPGANTWFSNETADAWIAIGTHEATIKMKKWPVQALLNAVASSPSRLKTAKELIPFTFSYYRKLQKTKYKRDTFIKIANLYVENNLHGRALRVLDEAAELTKTDLSQIKTGIEKEWDKLISSYMQLREKICFLYGYKVSDHSKELKRAPHRFLYGDVK
ncbi:MAG: hypothetical protein GY754_08100 [bacterium]|nr:hypothetical protein [bacterium]